MQREAGAFLNNRAKEAEAAKKTAEAIAKDPSATPEQRAEAQQRADDAAKWGQGGTYRQVLTALTAAAGGNVTGSAAQFAQGAAVGYIQGLAAGQVKAMADSLGKDTPGAESARAALHAIVGCAGAAAASQSCGAGAMGAAASSVLGSLLAPTDKMSAQEKQAREDMVRSLVAGVAGVAGGNAATAVNAATFEVENNSLAITPQVPPIWTPGQVQKPFETPGKLADNGEAALIGTPDRSEQNKPSPLIRPIQNIIGTIISFPADLKEGLGAIFSSGDSENVHQSAVPSAPLGLGSTERSTPNNLQEQLAIKQAISNPTAGVQLPIPMGDSRWPAADGWVKMSQNVNGVEIHYVRNVKSGAVDDFKFK